MQNDALVRIRGLTVRFDTFRGQVRALNGVDLDINPGEVLGLVGESGSGKSVTSLAIMGLIRPPGQVTSGSIHFNGMDMNKLNENELRKIRGRDISMIFQNPRSALNPLFKIQDQLSLVFQVQGLTDRRKLREACYDMLIRVGIAAPERVMKSYPHELSGGMCQRVMIAMALSARPRLLIADEPTTGLDVTLQAQILRLVRSLVMEMGSACLLITHDLGVVAEHCDRTGVMYAGQVAELGTTERIFGSPSHPYAKDLVASVLRVDEDRPIHIIPGVVPDLLQPLTGCPYKPRCFQAQEVCGTDAAPAVSMESGHSVRCHFPL